ncbi:MAG: efflux RND transporter permease subunit, partial [Planctomycetes bacterium]|nr:efflux RND transporter permease subunit [Planctomycetota bacterium]
LALGVGMLVDNSIVVLVNIYRIRDEEKLEPALAAEKGTDEVFAAIVASTLTTLVVFLPLTFIGGMAGLMFREFALVVAFSLICSLMVAVMLVPMLATRMMNMEARGGERTGWTKRVFDASERGFRMMENEYKNAIHWCLNHRLLTMLATFLFLAGSVFLLTHIDVEQMPKTDEGYVIVNAEMEPGIRLDLMSQRTKKLERIVMENVPEVTALISSVGGSSWRGVATHQSTLNVRLGTREDRARAGLRTTEEIANSLRQLFLWEPGMTIRVNEGQSFGRGGTGASEPVAVEIRGYNMDLANDVARQVLEIMRDTRGVVDARITREGRVPEAQLRIDRQKAADLGLWIEDIATFLEICMAGKEAAQYRVDGKEYPIMVRVQDSEKMSLDQLLSLSITNVAGRQVSLRNVVNIVEAEGPTVIERKNQQRVTTVRAALSGERALGSVMDELQEAVKVIPLPSGFSLEFGTDYQDQQDMMTDLMFGFVLSLVLVYMVMACQFESLRDPFIVMFSVPLAAIGVLIMLFLTRTTINMQSMIGCIMLGGIVVNNAIILVDYTNLLRRREGLRVREALEEAGRRRLRPILMTALTTILGLVPLAMGWGDGGEAQAPMARAVVGGLFSSTFITLLVVPVVYSLIETRREALGTTSKRLAARPAETNP